MTHEALLNKWGQMWSWAVLIYHTGWETVDLCHFSTQCNDVTGSALHLTMWSEVCSRDETCRGHFHARTKCLKGEAMLHDVRHDACLCPQARSNDVSYHFKIIYKTMWI